METTKYFVQVYKPENFQWITRDWFTREEPAWDRLKMDTQLYPEYTFRLVKRTIIEEALTK